MSLKTANQRTRWARFNVLHRHGAETLSRAQIRALLLHGVMLTSQNCCQPTLGFFVFFDRGKYIACMSKTPLLFFLLLHMKKPFISSCFCLLLWKKINVHDIHYPAPVMFSASLSSSVLPTRSPWLHCLCRAFADTRPNNGYFRLMGKLHIKKLTPYLEHLKAF